MTSFRTENHYHFKKTAARHSYPIGTEVNFRVISYVFFFYALKKPCRSATSPGFSSPFLFSSPIETATLSKRQSSIISKGQSFCHFEMSRPADRGSVIRSDNCHAGLVIYHLEEIIIEHTEKRIIFSCSNEGEYSGYNPAHTCHVTSVRDLRSDSAVPYTVTVYSAYLIRSTARVSFAVGNPGNLGCVLCRTETAVELDRAAHG